MQETIYSLALYDAFRQESECPLCLIEEKREEEALDYLLHQALMDVRTRGETNREGFCRRHFELMYRRRAYRLQLALILDTYLATENARLKKLAAGITGRGRAHTNPFFSLGRGKQQTGPEERLLQELRYQERSCYICRKINTVMDEHIKVLFHLWEGERVCRGFAEKKGFCQKHFRQLLERAAQHLFQAATVLLPRSPRNNWRTLNGSSESHRFTEKMSYHNEDLPWDNARDALIRGIKKLAGICRLE